MYDVGIIGGGLAGLVNSILLKEMGFNVVLFEEKKYPFHRVCGEYISNEVAPFLNRHALFPVDLEPATISQFKLTSTAGRSLNMDLDLGGFGVSRYSYDHWLAKKAKSDGVDIHEQERVTNVLVTPEGHSIQTGKGDYETRVVIGSFGKRTKLDKEFNRSFTRKRSPYLGVKYHVQTNLVDATTIELHNFSGGYCGISSVENDTYNLCYLSHRNNLKKHKEIPSMEQEVLFQNPHLKRLFSEAKFLFEKPEVINEISFEKKEPVFDHMLMSGDSAGMITPLCGNGMAMAIHSAKILSTIVNDFLKGHIDRATMEKQYTDQWNQNFAKRHWAGRKIQKLFGSSASSEFAVGLGKSIRPVANLLMKQTHGHPF